MGFAASRFLRVPRWELACDDALARLGKASEVSRAYVFALRPGEGGSYAASQVFEWVAPGVSPQIDNPDLQDLDLRSAGYGRWLELFLRREPVQGPVRSFPPGERRLLDPQQILSLVCVPIFSKQRLWGFMGFDDCERERAWSRGELSALAAAAETLGAAVHRQQTEDELRQSHREQAALYDLSDAAARAGSLEDLYEVALNGLQRAVGAERASVLLFDSEGVMRFKASRGLSRAYREATEGHSPWSVDERGAAPVLVPDIEGEPSLAELRPVILGEGIRSLAFIPLLHGGRLLGKFMVYRNEPHVFTVDEVRLAEAVARHIAGAIARRQAEEETREAEARFRTLAEQIPAATYLGRHDENSTLIYMSPRIEELTGFTPEQWTDNPYLWLERMHPDDVGRVEEEAKRCHASEEPFSVEYRLRRADGEVIWVREEDTVLRDETGMPQFRQGMIMDITERKRGEDRIAYLAYHDPLTGLPNRTLFAEHLELALARAGRRGLAAALLYLDLDRFKLVNDAFGHAAGDELLREIGGRLGEVKRAEDLVARHSGDEFLVLLGDLEPDGAAAAAQATAARVHKALRRPFLIQGQEFIVDASIGISVFPEDGGDSEALLRNADLALYEGKHAGRGETHVYSSATAGFGPELSLTAGLRTAIERQEFELHYQPLVELGSGAVVGAEALIRWRHPERGLILPDRFIAVAEETGLILDLSDWVIGEAVRQARAWAEQGLWLCLSLNLSPRDLCSPDLVVRVGGHLAEAGVDPRRLMLEVTESAATREPARTRQVLGELQELGLKLAIDDFGLGHSSIARLRELAGADLLKIDISFVRDLPGDRVARTIVDGIIAMAEGLGLSVLAEGVETDLQRRCLLEQGCGLGQGFRLGRPAPAAEVAALALARDAETAAGERPTLFPGDELARS